MSDVDLRLGDYRTALADVGEVSAVITDPPYTSRVVLGYRSGSDFDGEHTGMFTIPYAAWEESDAAALVKFIDKRARHYAVIFNDHVGARWLEAAFPSHWLVYAPVPWVRTDPPPRLNADGPCSGSEWITIARRRGKMERARKRHRPGHYLSAGASHAERGLIGQKPIGLMRALIRDYSEPGDLICEPFCGSGTTLLAAVLEGRRAIGAEIDPDTHAKATRRLAGRDWKQTGQMDIYDRIGAP